jgi:hypothetical protein
MTSKFYDLTILKLNDGTIRLEQQSGIDEPAIIYLHPVQAQFVMNGSPEQSISERIATLERRLLWMRDRFEECHVVLPSDMHERCPEAPEFDMWLQASIDVAIEYCADFATQQTENTEAVTKTVAESATVSHSATVCNTTASLL